jgi:hypothetical protein
MVGARRSWPLCRTLGRLIPAAYLGVQEQSGVRETVRLETGSEFRDWERSSRLGSLGLKLPKPSGYGRHSLPTLSSVIATCPAFWRQQGFWHIVRNQRLPAETLEWAAMVGINGHLHITSQRRRTSTKATPWTLKCAFASEVQSKKSSAKPFS